MADCHGHVGPDSDLNSGASTPAGRLQWRPGLGPSICPAFHPSQAGRLKIRCQPILLYNGNVSAQKDVEYWDLGCSMPAGKLPGGVEAPAVFVDEPSLLVLLTTPPASPNTYN